MNIEQVDITELVKRSPVLARLIEEVKHERTTPNAYDRFHRRHNLTLVPPVRREKGMYTPRSGTPHGQDSLAREVTPRSPGSPPSPCNPSLAGPCEAAVTCSAARAGNASRTRSTVRRTSVVSSG